MSLAANARVVKRRARSLAAAKVTMTTKLKIPALRSAVKKHQKQQQQQQQSHLKTQMLAALEGAVNTALDHINAVPRATLASVTEDELSRRAMRSFITKARRRRDQPAGSPVAVASRPMTATVSTGLQAAPRAPPSPLMRSILRAEHVLRTRAQQFKQAWWPSTQPTQKTAVKPDQAPSAEGVKEHTSQNVAVTESGLTAFAKDVFAGSCTGVAITAVGHPLDTIKTLLQAQSATRPVYAGTLDCARKIVSTMGPTGLYKGASAPLCMYVVYSSVYYSTYIQARRALGIADRSKETPAHLLLAASMASGFFTSFVRAPMDLLKTQAQVTMLNTATAAKGAKPESAIGYGLRVVRQHGFMSMFQGFTPTLARQVVGAVTWFFPYEWLKQRAGDGPAAVFLCGGLASWVYWASVFPIDSVKTRIQSDVPCKQSRKYNGMIHCTIRTVQTEGIAALFRGFGPCMLRAFPANAVGIVAYEYGRKLADSLHLSVVNRIELEEEV